MGATTVTESKEDIPPTSRLKLANRNAIVDSLNKAIKAGKVSEEMFEMLATATAELLDADTVFQEHKDSRIFLTQGSARTKRGTPEWEQYVLFAKIMVEKYGWDAETGGGPGSMEAISEGAGRENAYAVRITLPFEDACNPVVQGSPLAMEFKHFFARKVIMMMYTDAVVVLDPGFGTDDEAYETLALVQCGKSPIIPIVYLNTPQGKRINGKTLLERKHEVNQSMAEYGTISEVDKSLYHFFDDAKAAAAHIAHFYSRFHSMDREDLEVSIRLNEALSAHQIEAVQSEFEDLIEGKINSRFSEDEEENPQRLEFKMTGYSYGRLRQLIDAINDC